MKKISSRVIFFAVATVSALTFSNKSLSQNTSSSFIATENVVSSEDTVSYITVPISINLAAIEAKINADTPELLTHLDQKNKVCIQAKKAKYKYPCFRNWKWYSCEGWTYSSPDVKCDISGWVKRNGTIKLEGVENAIHVDFPIKAKVSAKAGISETAEAAARITAIIKPSISPDWEIQASLKPDLSWDKKPTLKLFNLIKVTIAGKVEPKLREKMDEAVKEIPTLLNALNIEEKVEKAWVNLQTPQKISDSPLTYLHFSPERVGFSGFAVEKNILKTQIFLSGNPVITTQVPTSTPINPLPKLTHTPHEDGAFRIDLPVNVTYDEIRNSAIKSFPKGFTTKINSGSLKGTARLSKLKINQARDQRLHIQAKLDYDNRNKVIQFFDVFNWFDISGQVSFLGTPVINEENSTVTIKNVSFDSQTNSGLADTLVKIANLPIIRSHISKALVYDYGAELKTAILQANSAMNVELDNNVKVSGQLDYIELSQLKILPASLTINSRLEGNVKIDVGL